MPTVPPFRPRLRPRLRERLPRPCAGRPGLVELLLATVVGLYALVVVGAATSLLDGAAACRTWPACEGAVLPPAADAGLLAAWGHRVATLVVGGLLAATTWFAWRRPATRRVRTTLALAALLYPGQIWLGALTALRGAPTGLASAHLVVGVAILTGTLVALLWHLEATEIEGTHPSTSSASTASSTSSASSASSTSSASSASPTSSASSASPTSSASTASAGTDEPAPGTPSAQPSGTISIRTRAFAYVRLTKPKLWWLLCLVAVGAMALAAGPDLRAATVVPTLVGGILAIGASGTFNNVIERNVDREMSRTADRPLVSGVVPVRHATAFGVALLVASVAVFLAFVNALAAALGLLAVLFYSVVYTVVLKPHTDQNIVVGGAVGAFPALIGWAAVTETVGMPAVVLGAVVFLWTPAHFYNLAMVYREDYARAGFPMLPVVRGEWTTRRHVLLYFGATMLATLALGTADPLGWLFAAAVVVVAGVFLRELVRQYRAPGDRTAMRTFHASNAYLGVLLVAVLVDAMAV